MKRNYENILKIVKAAVKAANDSPANKYGPSVWKYHLEVVAAYALKLAKKLGADREVVELAAYLHDYAALLSSKNDKNHHVLGAKEARKMLLALGYSKEKTEMVAECVLCHRGSVPLKRRTAEARIIASADAMSHFRYLPDMFYLAYNRHGLETDEGAAWLWGKLNRSWAKIMPEGRKIIKKDRDLFLKILGQVLKK
jgi:putative nucleotidyltransferase with HDIG domain